MKSVDDVKDVLARTAGLHAWQVVETRARSTQRYTVFERDEALRQVDTTRWHVTVHVMNAKDGKATLGESGFTVGAQVTVSEVEQHIRDAVERARLVHNAVYTLPAPGQAAPHVVTTDEKLVENAPAVVDGVVEEIRAAARKAGGVELSSSEVFGDYRHQRILNSLGMDVVRTETELLVEYVLLRKNPGGDEQEIWQSPRSRLRGKLDVSTEIDRDVRYSRDGLVAGLPQTGTFDVVFGEEALDTLWDVFVGQASAAAKYEGWSRMEPGKPVIQDVTGEKLTLISDPTLEGGMGSYALDSQGTVGRRVTLVEDNVFRAYVATKKYADLTGVPVTGPMGNVVVPAGKTPYARLLDGEKPVYELLRFSQLSPNAISGAFSGEIRTGYLHHGGKRTPIKGGSVSGNLLVAFARAAFSSETVRRQAYDGPMGVKLAALTLTGG